jgi:NAD+ synthase (glutamine-hydrolysing)
LKILIGQMNPISCDFAGNLEQIVTAIRQAGKEKAELVVMPELSIPGYLCKDAIYNEGFAQANLASLSKIQTESLNYPRLIVVVGYVEKNNTGVGRPFFNSAAIISNGTMIGNYRKHLLPFYDVFDEGRYFEAGNELTVITIGDINFGIIICEDGWASDKGATDRFYTVNPVSKYLALGIKDFIWINSSPYSLGKPSHRLRIGADMSFNESLVVYANQIGGMDDLIFDGNSFVSYDGTVLFACGITEGNYFINTTDRYGFQSLEDGIKQLEALLVIALRDYVKKSSFNDIVVASSGGIDSALVLCLACKAIGAEHVHAIMMPSVHSSKGSVDDARDLHKALGCHDYLVHIDHIPALKNINEELGAIDLANSFGKYATVADENIQARMRAIILMHFSNSFGAFPLTTGNKSENATGYCTLGGDMMGGFAPLLDLYKTQVNALSALMPQIPKQILNKPPSAELAPNQKDEEALLPYGILDMIIYAYVELRISSFDSFKMIIKKQYYPTFSADHVTNFMAKFMAMDNCKQQYEKIIRLIDGSEFKRRMAAPGIKVSKVAFGTGRRFPIVKRMGGVLSTTPT